MGSIVALEQVQSRMFMYIVIVITFWLFVYLSNDNGFVPYALHSDWRSCDAAPDSPGAFLCSFKWLQRSQGHILLIPMFIVLRLVECDGHPNAEICAISFGRRQFWSGSLTCIGGFKCIDLLS